jgi:lactoylglutathione lyase
MHDLATLVTGFAHYGLRVADLSRSRAFYEKLGFALTIGPIGPEPVAILKHPAGIELNLVLNAHPELTDNVLMDVPEKHPGYTHVALEVSDLSQVLELLERSGIAISGGPVDFPHGARAVFVRDPDRNVVELHQPAPAH